jgi:hypothetical protein
MRLLSLSLLLLSLLLSGLACEKNVQEVRREKLDIAAPGGNARTASTAAPAAPSGEPQSVGGRPKTPTEP